MIMKRLVCVLLMLSFIASLAAAQTEPGPPPEEETVESLKLQLREAQCKAEMRNPEHAAFWSIIPGGGQIYNGQYLKAVAAYGGVLLGALAAWGNGGLAWLPLLVWTYTAYDAYHSAKDHNQNLRKKYGLSSIHLQGTIARKNLTLDNSAQSR